MWIAILVPFFCSVEGCFPAPASRFAGAARSRGQGRPAALNVTAFAAAVRAHWRIENCLHWLLDVGFDEDRARNRKDHGPENLTIVRKLVLNVLRTARSDISIRRKPKRSGWSDAFARSVLGQMR